MKSRRAKLEEQKMLAFGRGFCRCVRPKGCAPLEPRQGVPPAPHAHKRLPAALPGPLAEGQGCRGKSAPDTLPAGLGRSGRVKGPCPRPYGAAGRTNPLTRPSLKTRQRPAQGLEGHCRSGWGSRLAQRHAQRLGLDAQERPHARAGGWGAFPQPPATWRTPPEAAGGALDLLLLRAVSRNN